MICSASSVLPRSTWACTTIRKKANCASVAFKRYLLMGEDLKGLRKRHPLLHCLHHTSGRSLSKFKSQGSRERSSHLLAPSRCLHNCP